MLTDILGMSPRQVSLLMLIVFVGDLAFDIFAGIAAERLEQRGIGYSKQIAWCVAPCACAFVVLYILPLVQLQSFVLVAVLLIVLRGTFALIDVPHNSLIARVTVDSYARGRVSGYRILFSSAASVIVAALIAPAMDVASGNVTPERMAWLGCGAAILFCTTLLLAARSSRAASPTRRFSRCSDGKHLFPKLDRLFVAFAAIALVTGFAMPLFGKAMLYFCTYVLNDAGFASRVLLTLALSQIAGATLWIVLVRRYDKTVLLAASHGLAAAGILMFAVVGESRVLLVACATLAGLGLAGVFMLPWGILADIIDFAEFRHGERRETAAFAVTLVVLKASGVAALATIGWTLDWLGYVPSAVQSPPVLEGMRWLALGLPVIGSLFAILILVHFNIGHVLHARVIKINALRQQRF